MNPQLLVIAAGPAVTLQDAGRFGFARFGVTPAGPMDRGEFLAATTAVNASSAIEISLAGATFCCVEAPLTVALAGGAFDCHVNGASIPSACILTLQPGTTLNIKAGYSGAWCYLALGGSLDHAHTLGSIACHTRSGLGGRALTPGDRLRLAEPLFPQCATQALHAPWLMTHHEPIRILPGPQDDYFSQETLDLLISSKWRLTTRSDRMAYELAGPKLRHLCGHDIVSDGIVMGAIQITGSGAPFILMADYQPTGGYPKIATVISSDLGRLAQYRTDDTIEFTFIDHEEAVQARRLMQNMIALKATLLPLRGSLSQELLFNENLVDGVVSAYEEP